MSLINTTPFLYQGYSRHDINSDVFVGGGHLLYRMEITHSHRWHLRVCVSVCVCVCICDSIRACVSVSFFIILTYHINLPMNMYPIYAAVNCHINSRYRQTRARGEMESRL